MMLKNGLAHLTMMKMINKRPFSIDKNKKVIGLLKAELGGKIMIQSVAFRAKAYAYLMINDSEHKKAKEKFV